VYAHALKTVLAGRCWFVWVCMCALSNVIGVLVCGCLKGFDVLVFAFVVCGKKVCTIALCRTREIRLYV